MAPTPSRRSASECPGWVLRADIDVGRDQFARLMREMGIRGASRSKKRFKTKADPAAVRAPDLVKRDFTATAPDVKWVADFTYCSTWSGIVYVAFVVDVFSRRIVGWKGDRGPSVPSVHRQRADVEPVVRDQRDVLRPRCAGRRLRHAVWSERSCRAGTSAPGCGVSAALADSRRGASSGSMGQVPISSPSAIGMSRRV